MALKTITERFALSGGTLDREAGVLRGAVICGLRSENGRDYEWGGRLKGKHAAYEGAVTNCDHGTDDAVERRLGWWQNVRAGTDGKPTGDFHMLKSHPMYERVMEAAERNPAMFGFSHVIEAETRRHGGREIVESIKRVVSIDLVATPATTKSLFEARTTTVPQIPFRRLAEAAIAKLPAEKVRPAQKALFLLEDDLGMAPMLDAPVDEPADDLGGGDAIVDGIESICLSILKDTGLSTDEKVKKLRLALQMGDKLSGAAPATESPADDAPAEESKKPALADLVAECRAKDFAATLDDVALLAGVPTREGRALVIDRLKAPAPRAGGEEPRSTPRGTISRDLAEGRTDAGAPTLDEIKKRMKG